MCVCLCLCVYVCMYLSIYLSTNLYACLTLFTCLCICLSICRHGSVYLIHLSLHHVCLWTSLRLWEQHSSNHYRLTSYQKNVSSFHPHLYSIFLFPFFLCIGIKSHSSFKRSLYSSPTKILRFPILAKQT